MAQENRSVLQTLAFGLLCCIVLARSDIFKSVVVEVGFHQYAELVDPTTTLKMPYNALVNLGYIAVGISWLNLPQRKKLSPEMIHYFEMFATMSIFYGPVQFLRIVSQNRLFAILDQWLTLPIFMWASLFGLFCLSRKPHPTSENLLLLMSLSSYGLVFLSKVGFEIALGIHIIFAVFVGVICQWKIGTKQSLQYMIIAILCCLGFVVLKIYDLELGKKHWVFKRVSGHFLSKVCDIFQIDMVARFFMELLLNQSKRM